VPPSDHRWPGRQPPPFARTKAAGYAGGRARGEPGAAPTRRALVRARPARPTPCGPAKSTPNKTRNPRPSGCVVPRVGKRGRLGTPDGPQPSSRPPSARLIRIEPGGDQARYAIDVLLPSTTTRSHVQFLAAVLLGALSRQRETMLVATHDLEFARRVCSRFVMLEQGRVIESIGSAEEGHQSQCHRAADTNTLATSLSFRCFACDPITYVLVYGSSRPCGPTCSATERHSGHRFSSRCRRAWCRRSLRHRPGFFVQSPSRRRCCAKPVARRSICRVWLSSGSPCSRRRGHEMRIVVVRGWSGRRRSPVTCWSHACHELEAQPRCGSCEADEGRQAPPRAGSATPSRAAGERFEKSGEQSWEFRAVAVGEDDRSGLRLVDGRVPTGKCFAVHVAISAVVE